MLKTFYLSSVPRQVCAVTSFVRSYETDFRYIRRPTLEALPRGTGGRSSFNGIVATVFGATGFLGRAVCNRLGKIGTQLIIPYRSEPDDVQVKGLRLVGDLGQVLFHPFNLNDENSIRRAIKYSNVVINLIGCYVETPNFSYGAVHINGAKAIAKACKQCGVERLIHVSALNATAEPNAYTIKTPLRFLPSKLKGEEAVLDEFPNATIFKPSIIYGVGDRFLCSVNEGMRRSFLSIPLWAKGEKTVRQPVYVGDVAAGIVSAMQDIGSKGKTYMAIGAERYLLSDIVDYCCKVSFRSHIKRHDLRWDPWLPVKIKFFRTIQFPRCPRYDLCYEQFEMESETDKIVKDELTLMDLGVESTPMWDEVCHIVRDRFPWSPYYLRDYEEFEYVEPPKPYYESSSSIF